MASEGVNEETLVKQVTSVLTGGDTGPVVAKVPPTPKTPRSLQKVLPAVRNYKYDKEHIPPTPKPPRFLERVAPLEKRSKHWSTPHNPIWTHQPDSKSSHQTIAATRLAQDGGGIHEIRVYENG